MSNKYMKKMWWFSKVVALIRRSGLVGTGMALLEEVCHGGAQATDSETDRFLLPV